MAKILDLEHQEQCKFFAWIDSNKHLIPQLDLFYANTNGARLPITVAKKLKKAGAQAGIPDTHLPYPSQGYHSLFIEMKTTKGPIRTEQKKWIIKLRNAGNKVVVARSADEARNETLFYLFNENQEN